MTDKTRVLSASFENLMTLKRAFMPFVDQGGIFIPTNERFHLGEIVTVNITLALTEATSPYTFSGEVIWVTPATKQGLTHKPGIGVQLGGKGAETLESTIRDLVDGLPEEEMESDTL